MANSSEDGVFANLSFLFAFQIVNHVTLSWLLETAPEPPDVVANTFIFFMDKQQCSFNFFHDQIVHFQASPTYTGRFTYLYDTFFFFPVHSNQEPMMKGIFFKTDQIISEAVHRSSTQG
jgi:hypothetical protein